MANKLIDCRDIAENPFTLIGNDWALLSAGTPESFNMMTVSWGQVGVLWNKNVATAYVRPQRYTRGFIDQNEIFTLSFFGEEQRDLLKLCGSKSGRDIDKMHLSGLTPEFHGGAVCSAKSSTSANLKKRASCLPRSPNATTPKRTFTLSTRARSSAQ